MIKVANNIQRMLAVKAAKVPVNELLDMSSVGGGVADLIPGIDPTGITGAVGQSGRAGRGTAMAEALGQDPEFLVNYPLTSTALAGLAGSLGGGLLGGGAGALAAGPLGLPVGGYLGSITGGTGGMLIAHLMRRNRLNEIAKAYDAASEKDINPVEHEPTYFDIFGGHHNSARQRAINAMLGGDQNPSDMTFGEAAAGLVPIIGGTGMNIKAKGLMEKNKQLMEAKKKKAVE